MFASFYFFRSWRILGFEFNSRLSIFLLWNICIYLYLYFKAIGVLIFTNLGYYMIKKYNVGHVLFYIDFALVLLNMIGNIAWGIE